MVMGRAFKQNEMYVVNLDEAEWYPAGIDKEVLKLSYRASAEELGCALISVFVIPDALFPLYGETRKHRVYEYRFPSSAKLYEVEAHFVGKIDREKYDKLSEGQQHKLVREVRDALNTHASGVPGRYAIQIVNGTEVQLVERGRV